MSQQETISCSGTKVSEFSPEKIEEFQTAFNYFDKDSSGQISKEEYENSF